MSEHTASAHSVNPLPTRSEAEAAPALWELPGEARWGPSTVSVPQKPFKCSLSCPSSRPLTGPSIPSCPYMKAALCVMERPPLSLQVRASASCPPFTQLAPSSHLRLKLDATSCGSWRRLPQHISQGRGGARPGHHGSPALARCLVRVGTCWCEWIICELRRGNEYILPVSRGWLERNQGRPHREVGGRWTLSQADVRLFFSFPR